MNDIELKPLAWVGDSRRKLREFPRPVQREMGQALMFAQAGEKHPSAKPLKGTGLSGVFEIVDNYDKDTYRVVYAVKLGEKIYVLHAFQKKSKTGIKTPKQDIDLIKQRLKAVKELEKK
jgi:phage-related protein